MKKELQANIWKFFILIVSNRRNYIPILALYFLSLPNTTAQQIGIYTGIGWFAGFILEIPSGYIYFRIGMIEQELGSLKQALTAFNKAIEVEPELITRILYIKK